MEVAGVKEGSIVRELKAWISNTIDWECSSNLSLMSISSYVVHSTKETGNINLQKQLKEIEMYYSKIGGNNMSLLSVWVWRFWK